MKPGIRTTEFWLAAISGLTVAVLTLLVGYGALTSEQSELWLGLIVAVAPVALALISMGYSNSRGKAKSSE